MLKFLSCNICLGCDIFFFLVAVHIFALNLCSDERGLIKQFSCLILPIAVVFWYYRFTVAYCFKFSSFNICFITNNTFFYGYYPNAAHLINNVSGGLQKNIINALRYFLISQFLFLAAQNKVWWTMFFWTLVDQWKNLNHTMCAEIYFYHCSLILIILPLWQIAKNLSVWIIGLISFVYIDKLWNISQ